jgi:ADP-ribose pyrophosphatase YjhB (NUDIX family)
MSHIDPETITVRRDYPCRPIVGVGAVVWCDDRVLLVQRGKPPRRGQWSLPGGAQHLGETVEAAVRREVREETGVELANVELLTVVDFIEHDPSDRVRYHYTLVDVTGDAVGEPVAGDDALAVALLGMDEVEALGLWHETKRVIRLAYERRRTAPGQPLLSGCDQEASGSAAL